MLLKFEGSLYEEKIIELIKSKINLISKEISTIEAEKIITEFSKPNVNNKTQVLHLLLKVSLNQKN